MNARTTRRLEWLAVFLACALMVLTAFTAGVISGHRPAATIKHETKQPTHALNLRVWT